MLETLHLPAFLLPSRYPLSGHFSHNAPYSVSVHMIHAVLHSLPGQCAARVAVTCGESIVRHCNAAFVHHELHQCAQRSTTTCNIHISYMVGREHNWMSAARVTACIGVYGDGECLDAPEGGAGTARNVTGSATRWPTNDAIRVRSVRFRPRRGRPGGHARGRHARHGAHRHRSRL